MNEIETKMKNFSTGFWRAEKSTREDVRLVPPEYHVDVPKPSEDASSVSPYLVWFAFWSIFYWVFIELQFGTVFLVFSGIVFMFMNTRTDPKPEGEISAYSVFNKNCESIAGTLKAEQFEREIRYGPTAVM